MFNVAFDKRTLAVASKAVGAPVKVVQYRRRKNGDVEAILIQENGREARILLEKGRKHSRYAALYAALAR